MLKVTSLAAMKRLYDHVLWLNSVRFFNVPPQELFNKLEVEGIYAKIDLFVTDSPYNIRRKSIQTGSADSYYHNETFIGFAAAL